MAFLKDPEEHLHFSSTRGCGLGFGCRAHLESPSDVIRGKPADRPSWGWPERRCTRTISRWHRPIASGFFARRNAGHVPAAALYPLYRAWHRGFLAEIAVG